MKSPNPVDASPIQRVIFLNRLEMTKMGYTFSEPSFPGHHIQVNESGWLHVETSGRTFEVGPGGLMWLHNDEEFAYRVVKAPRVFYVLNFLAPSLPPPPFEARCVALPRAHIVSRFQSLLRVWRDTTMPPLLRLFRVQSLLLQALAEVTTHIERTVPLHQEVALWWRIEKEIRSNWSRSVSVLWMSQLVQRSPATVTRACRRATGKAPLERVRQIRTQMARGLVWMSTLSMSEIAFQLGYRRVQDLSRDYHHVWRVTPTEDRKRFPEIYQRVFGMPYTSTDRNG